jgi:glutamate-1-semialdehyde 2,1-aminomutase
VHGGGLGNGLRVGRDEQQSYGHLNRLGRELMQRIQELTGRLGISARVQGIGPMFHVAFTKQDSIVDYRTFLSVDQERYRQFTDLLLDEGVRVLARGLWYLSTAHTFDDIELTLHAVESACVRLLEADPLFRRV